MLQQANTAKERTPKLFAAGRDWLLKANRIDSEDPEPLMEFYQSYLLEGRAPTKNAIDALHYASNLAPQDLELRVTSAMQYLRDKDLKAARKTLTPIAFNPHDADIAGVARKVIARIDAGDANGALKAAEAPDEATGKGAN